MSKLGITGTCALMAFFAASFANAQDPSDSSTMVKRLAAIADGLDPDSNNYANRRRALKLEQRVRNKDDAGRPLDLLISYAVEQVRAGMTKPGLRTLNFLNKTLKDNKVRLTPKQVSLLRGHFITAYLRLAEEENCIAHHGQDSCLMPIQGSGIHTEPRGARAAIRFIKAELETAPGSLANRWLLNLAYMTLGEYPDKVPERWRIPPSVFSSAYDIKRFRDIAPALGVATVGLSGGSIMEDFDGDGHLDLMCSSWGYGDQMRYFRNDGRGGFEDRTEAAGLIGEIGGLNLIHADYDNDGDADVLVLRGAWLGEAGRVPNSLLRNEGGGVFLDVTIEAGLLTPASHADRERGATSTTTATWTCSSATSLTARGSATRASSTATTGRRQRSPNVAKPTAGVAHVMGFVKGVALRRLRQRRPTPTSTCRACAQPNVLYREHLGLRAGEDAPKFQST